MLLYYLVHIGVRHLVWGDHGQLDRATYMATTHAGFFALYRYLPSSLYDAFFNASIVVAALFSLGVVPRISAILFALTTAANVDRNLQAIDAGQTLIVLLAFLLCFADTSRFSLFAFPNSRLPALWTSIDTMVHNAARFLITWQIAMVYFWAAFYKLGGESWRDGTAMYYALHLERFLALPALSHLIAANAFLVASLTYSTLLFQMAFPFLIWNERLKPFLILIGVSVHAGIAVVMGLILFSLSMILAEMSLFSDEQVYAAYRWVLHRAVMLKEKRACF